MIHSNQKLIFLHESSLVFWFFFYQKRANIICKIFCNFPHFFLFKKNFFFLVRNPQWDSWAPPWKSRANESLFGCPANEEGSLHTWCSGEGGSRTQPPDQWRRSARSLSGFLKICPPTWYCPLFIPSVVSTSEPHTKMGKRCDAVNTPFCCWLVRFT